MWRRWNLGLLAITLVSFSTAISLGQNQREQAVRGDKQQLANNESWVYDNLALGMTDAKISSRPLMVVIRCLP